ncbi:MAG: IS1182 family transposase, partial [Cyclobacteriaceae bacterium]
MQGKKHLQPKLFNSFNLVDRIPEHNFYRRLKSVLDLDFLYMATKPYYGTCGQKSLDPTVFFRLCLVGFLENIISDRQLMHHASMRLDILYFLDYDIDDELPWHSTISRTRDMFPDVLFTELFERVLGMCINKGMVSGKTQAIDSAPVKANASMESLELKVPEEELDEHLIKVRAMSQVDKKKLKENKASKEQQTLSASEGELKALESRTKNWDGKQENRPGARSKGAKYTSNHTHYSPSDPDARISIKPGKARKLNYHAQVAVDTAHHVITSMEADFADKHDSRSLIGVVDPLVRRLKGHGLEVENILTDAGYSSGDNYADMELRGLNAYIPPHGTFKGGPDQFTYHEAEDYYQCQNGKRAMFRKINVEKGTEKRQYATRRADCRECPYKEDCIGKGTEKRFSVVNHLKEYQRAIDRVKSPKGQHYKRKRHSTVEPVLGVLTQFMGMRKVYTKGINNCNKQFLMAAVAYNLKKYLKFEYNRPWGSLNPCFRVSFWLCFS